MQPSNNHQYDCKIFYDAAYEKGHWSGYDGGEDVMAYRIKQLTRDTKEWLASAGLASNKDALILEIGCGMAYLASIHPGWHGAEYSASAVDHVKQEWGEKIRIFEEDAQQLSFSDSSFDGVYTWAALEHVPNPHRAFCEIDRVLRAGGCALIAPAWNCRSWTVSKLKDRPYADLNWSEKIQKATIPMREHIIFRASRSVLQRLMGEIRLLGKQCLPLDFRELKPRWDLIEKYGHISDDDAVAEIDPHAGICFFLSRGYEVISHPGLIKRLGARHEPVIVRKP